MFRKIIIVKVDSKYCDFLRKYESKVPYNAGEKELRPFVGILFNIGNCEYFAPLSSPKPKHSRLVNTLDLIKIDNGKLGVINFNNMIPVNKSNYNIIDLNEKTNDKNKGARILLLKNQLRWLNNNKVDIYEKSSNLYKKYVNNLLSFNVRNRCCNFILLEEKCREYNK
ncbi:MAG: type III toxin-antitoxin system ToxN/AbiQ family toxin [bacterium]|nr:type III toxin-antitoxin system ToxN/AbiQ family toxin [bacterium]